MIDISKKPFADKKSLVIGVANEHSIAYGCADAFRSLGSEVVEHYNVMGPVEAALESAVRDLAYERGPKGIRVHAISPDPIKTRAASGIDHFDELMERAAKRAAERSLVSTEDVVVATAVLATDYVKLMTGETVYVDGGYHILG